MSLNNKKVWILSDGKAGHYNQSKGVILALEKLFSVEQVWIEAPLRMGWLRSLLKWMLQIFGNVPKNILTWCYPELNYNQIREPDIIIAAGGRMMYALAAIAQQKKSKSIFIGSLRGLNPSLFDLIIVLEDFDEPQYLTVDIAPSPILLDTLSKAANVWQSEHPTEMGELWAMCIGGNGAGARYTEHDWLNLVAAMDNMAKQNNIRWLLTTSRRTGADAEQLLQKNMNHGVIADQVLWSSQPRQVMSAFLGRAEKVFCTVESMSMLTEAIVSQHKVFAISPSLFKPNRNYQMALEKLLNKQWLAVISLDNFNDQFLKKVNNVKPMCYSAVDDLAIKLSQRIS